MFRLSIAVIGFLLVAALCSQASAAEFTPNRMFVSSYGTNEIFEFKADGTMVRKLTGSGNLQGPDGIAFGPDGNLYVACDTTDSIVAVDATDTVVSTWSAGANLSGPTGIAFGPYGYLYVASRGTDRIVVFTSSGTYYTALDPGITWKPWYLTFAPDGHLVVSNNGNGTLIEMTDHGSLVREIVAGTGHWNPSGVAFGWDGRLYFGDSATDHLVYIDDWGVEYDSFYDINLEAPMDVTNGPDSRVYITSGGTSHRVIAVKAMGIPEEYGVGAGMATPSGIAFSPFRFKVALVGSVTGVGGTQKVSEKAVLSVAPGSQTVMLAFTDGPSNYDYVSLFGPTAMVGHGLEGMDSFDDKTRTFTGYEATCPSFRFGTASMLVKVEGKIGNRQFFKVKEVSGRMWRTATDSVYSAKIKFKKALN